MPCWTCEYSGDIVLLMQSLLLKEHHSTLRHRRPHLPPQCPQPEPSQLQLPRSRKHQRRLQWQSPSLQRQPPLHLRRHSQLLRWRAQHLRPRPHRFPLQQRPRPRLRRCQLPVPWQVLRLRPPPCCCTAALTCGSSFSQKLRGGGYIADSQLYKQADSSRQLLSAREREVLALLARGCTLPQIGAALFISPATVNNHCARMREKLGLKGSKALLRFAMENK